MVSAVEPRSEKRRVVSRAGDKESVAFRMVSVPIDSRIEYFVNGSLAEKAYRDNDKRHWEKIISLMQGGDVRGGDE